MRKPTVLMMLLALGLASFAFAPSALAGPVIGPIQAQITNGGTIPLTLTDWGPTTQTLAGKNPFQIQQFNPDNYKAQAPPGQTAELVAVGIRLDYLFQNKITMTFTNVSTETVKASGIMHLTLPDKVTDLVGTPTFGTSVTQTSSSNNNFPFTPPPVIKNVSGTAAMGYNTATNPSVVAMFSGSGTINLPVFATAKSSFTSTSGNGSGTSDTSAMATISVVYYYQFVPEPSSMVLTGLGGVGLLMVSRGRSRRRKD